MKSKVINDGPQKTYVLVLDKGDEAVGCIERFGSLGSMRSRRHS